MVRKCAFIAFFLFNLFFCSLSKAQERYDYPVKDTVILPDQKTTSQTDTIYLALFMKFLDQESKQEESGMLVLGKYFDGNYIPLEDEYNYADRPLNVEEIKKSETYRILLENRKFHIYKYGGKLASVDMKGVTYDSFACTQLLTGIPKQNPVLNKSLYSHIQGYTQFRQGEEIDQSFTYFLALNKNIEGSNVLNRLPYKPSKQKMEMIESAIKKSLNHTLMERESDQESVDLNFSMDTTNTQYYSNVITPSKKAYLITSFHQDTDSCLSSTIVFEQNGDELNPVLELSEINSLYSWGSGYSLLDVLDIDGDGVNELIFEIAGYETTGLEIYKLVNGKFELAMTVFLWGC